MRTFAFLVFAALVAIAAPAQAANEFGSKDEAVAMVKRVQAEFKKDGAEATFKAVSDKSVKEFHDRDLYPFIYDMSGKCVAHGARAALIGKNSHRPQGPGRQIPDPRNGRRGERTGQRLDRLQMAEPAQQQDRR